MHYTYIVECRDQTLYTGWTTDLEKRVRAHNEGKGAKYTKSRAPVKLVYYEQYETKQEALKREYAIKQLSRKDKLALIQNKKLQHIHIHKNEMTETSAHDKEMENLVTAEIRR